MSFRKSLALRCVDVELCLCLSAEFTNVSLDMGKSSKRRFFYTRHNAGRMRVVVFLSSLFSKDVSFSSIVKRNLSPLLFAPTNV